MQLNFKITLEELLTAIQELTFDEKQKVKKVIDNQLQNSFNKSGRKAGSLKGLVTYMAPDFNAPIDDFKDYM